MRGDGDFDACPADDALGAEADHARQAATRPAVHDTVEIDEADGLARPVWIRDARTKTARHERQVRIGVLRLRCALDGIEVGPAIKLVVLVPGALRKNRAERVDV